MKYLGVRAALMVLLVAAMLTASVTKQSQTPTTSGPASQDQPNNSSKASAKTSRRKISCKTPENASLCYWTHGRLSVANGNPAFRLWRIGTHRMLGVFNGPSHFPPGTIADDEDPEFPPELVRAYEANNRAQKKDTGIMWGVPPPAFADFEVCPLEPQHKGWMQPVCIESTKNIFIQHDE